MDYELKLYRDELAPQAVVQMPLDSAPVRAIYAVSGGLRLSSGGATATLGANSGWHNATKTSRSRRVNSASTAVIRSR